VILLRWLSLVDFPKILGLNWETEFFSVWSPSGPFHCSLASQFVELMRNSLNDDFLLREEKPIVLDDYSLPIPDISLVKQRPDDPYFVGSHPKASEVSMVIEISDSSYLRDRNVKLAAYAQASIAEYWIVNVKKN
jgi:Uma2 family endonuclease